MSVTVRIPTQLRPLTAGAGEVEIEALTVREAIDVLDRDHPGMRARLLDEQGTLRRFVNLFVADEDVRFLQGLDTGLPAGTTLSIIPAVAGG
jgi:molybdopterin converting factor small subunit